MYTSQPQQFYQAPPQQQQQHYGGLPQQQQQQQYSQFAQPLAQQPGGFGFTDAGTAFFGGQLPTAQIGLQIGNQAFAAGQNYVNQNVPKGILALPLIL